MEVPEAVARAFDDVKKESPKEPGTLSLELKNGFWYVYRRRSLWDKESKKTRSVAEYIGRITLEGLFIHKKGRVSYNLSTALSIIRNNGGEVVWNPDSRMGRQIEDDNRPNLIDDYLIRALSFDADFNMRKAAQKLNVPYSTLYARRQALEKEYNIKYFITSRGPNLGLYTYVLYMKFNSLHTEIDKLQSILEGIPEIRLALNTKGDFDLIIFFFATTPGNANGVAGKIESRIAMPTASYMLAPSGIISGNVPIRPSFIDLLKQYNKIWSKGVNSKKPNPGQISERDAIIIKELSIDANQSVGDIAKKYKLKESDMRYAYNHLRDKAIIARKCMSLQEFEAVPQYIIIAETPITEERTAEDKAQWFNLYKMTCKEDGLLSRYLLIFYSGTPFGFMFITSSAISRKLEDIKTEINTMFKDTTVHIIEIEKILVGKILYRKINPTDTDIYNYCVEMGTNLPKKIVY